MKKIGTYANGNTIVTIYRDGTKVRRINGDVPAPEFPESIDLKITNRCDLGCPMCAEMSTPDGIHANLNRFLLQTIRPYTELAIGGGNPLEHPNLVRFLSQMRDQKVICNLTVNVKHFMEQTDFLRNLVDAELIHGIGISIPNKVPKDFDVPECFPNAIIHTIAGYTPIETFIQLEDRDLNLLILGFKEKGKGAACMDSSISDLAANTAMLSDYVLSARKRFKAIAFDNLAIQQLMIKSKMPAKEYKKFYMGDDGEFTMYIDLVSDTFAPSSTHKPHRIDSGSISVLFGQVRKWDDA